MKNRTSGVYGGALGSLDEVFYPTRYEAQVELDRQTILPAPAPLPGDPGADSDGAAIYRGRVRIDLSQRHN